jgi:hypothetical protein
MSKGWKYLVSVTVAIVAVGLLAVSIAPALMQQLAAAISARG